MGTAAPLKRRTPAPRRGAARSATPAAARLVPAPAKAAAKRRGAGKSRAPDELPQRAPFTTIWRAVAAIAPGDWASYGEVARRAGLPRGARLVAFALKRAPVALDLPWHRVLAAGGRITFPPRSRAAAEQARRLAREGLRIERGRIRAAPVQDARFALDALLWGRDGD